MRLWFRRVYVNFEEPLPQDAPIIFACTHPNSAIDYLFVPLITRKPVHVLVRGDVFEKKWLNKLFRSIWMLPVYRIRDGYGSLSKNAESFEDCFRVFHENGRVLIFSEGICVQEKTLQPLKKGTARLALEYLEKHNREIYIVPVANNYTVFRKFRNSVMCNFGKPIKASDYRALYGQNQNRAYQKLTEDITGALERSLIQVKPWNEEGWTEKALQALRLTRFEQRHGWLIHDRSVYAEERILTERLNEQGDQLLSEEWKHTATKHRLSFYNEGILKLGKNPHFFMIQVWLLSPVIVMAALPHVLPYLVARWLVTNKIHDKIFYTTVMVLGSLVVYMVLWFIMFFIFTGLWGWTGFLISMSVLSLSFIGMALIDEFRFAWYNRKAVRHYAIYQQLFQQVKTALAVPNAQNV